MRVLAEVTMHYRLIEAEDGRLILTALCGGHGLYERHFALDLDERRRYEEYGAFYLERLVHDLCRDRGELAARFVTDPAPRRGRGLVPKAPPAVRRRRSSAARSPIR